MTTIKLNAEIVVPSNDSGLVLAVGHPVQESETELASIFPNTPAFFEVVVAEGFDLSGTPESNTTNWNIVQCWDDVKKADFLKFLIDGLETSALLEVYDRVFFGNKQM